MRSKTCSVAVLTLAGLLVAACSESSGTASDAGLDSAVDARGRPTPARPTWPSATTATAGRAWACSRTHRGRRVLPRPRLRIVGGMVDPACCSAATQGCGEDSDCCGQMYCVSNDAGVGSCKDCKTTGFECTGDADCCFGPCWNGSCQPGQ